MKSRHQILPLATLALACLCAGPVVMAQALQPGQSAPVGVVRQLDSVAPLRVGAQVVRPLVASAPPAGDASAVLGKTGADSARTLVVRESDHLVGISHNDLMVVGPDLDRMAASVRALGLPGIEASVYPNIRLLLVRARQFEHLQVVHDRLTTDFPQARFDLPISYFPRRPK